MIAGLRGLGLPAAYVSGYSAHHSAAPASRACRAPTPPMPGCRCGAATSSAGSISIRPTIYGRRTTISCSAVGRDFSDVSPVDGIIVGSRKQKLGVAVDVLLVE